MIERSVESITSIIPNPFIPQGETLLSDWPDELIRRKSYRPRPIDPEILATMNVIEKIGYAPKPGNDHESSLSFRRVVNLSLRFFSSVRYHYGACSLRKSKFPSIYIYLNGPVCTDQFPE